LLKGEPLKPGAVCCLQRPSLPVWLLWSLMEKLHTDMEQLARAEFFLTAVNWHELIMWKYILHNAFT